jgi:putative spermidine/putrescine transport system permease protein
MARHHGGVTGKSRSLPRRLSAFLHRHPGSKLGLLLGPTLAWMLVVYLGALALLFVSAFWRVDPLTSTVQHRWGLQNFQTMLQDPVFRKIAFRTIGIAAAVTMTDIALAFPLAYYAAQLASARLRSAILVAVVLPLWSSYLVRVFAWRTVLQGNGPADWFFSHVLHIASLKLGFTNWAVWITFVYLWLPFTMLPMYAALERIPPSYLEASSDLGGKGWVTFRRVVLPLALPGIVAGSIFAFSLTLGDYIAPILVGNTEFIGNVVHDFSGVANNVPFAAAYALVPVVVIGAYLLLARRLGAFEAL